jgi:eukaryotic-like serine/threonine-protein kinase
LSRPVATRGPQDTLPPGRVASGLVCPKCRRLFDEGARHSLYVEDNTPLVRAADLAAADGDPMLGRVISGRFTILARLGAGSMGTVYRARQSPIGRDVAIKILRSERAIDETSRARFLREARANSVLTSPNTVTLFDFGEGENGELFLAMELLEGESLGQRLKRMGRLEASAAIDVAKQALRSLAESHAKGIVHRDLKPDNLFFARVRANDTHEEIVKVLDFGIAKMLSPSGESSMNVIETQEGTVFGTPRYMSPEQAQGKPLDARSDLYSLGVMLYHMLTGRPPFLDDDAIVVMARHIKTAPRPIREVAPDARIAPDVEGLVMRALSKEPEKRPQSAEAMSGELARASDNAKAVTSVVRSSPSSSFSPMMLEADPALLALDGSLANDSPAAAAMEPRRPSTRRWVIAGALVLAAAAAVTVLLGSPFGAARRAAATPTEAPSADVPTVANAAVPPTTAPAPSTTPQAISAHGFGAPAASAPAVTGAASASELRPGHAARPRPSTKPIGSSPVGPPVGYGYLE